MTKHHTAQILRNYLISSSRYHVSFGLVSSWFFSIFISAELRHTSYSISLGLTIFFDEKIISRRAATYSIRNLKVWFGLDLFLYFFCVLLGSCCLLPTWRDVFLSDPNFLQNFCFLFQESCDILASWSPGPSAMFCQKSTSGNQAKPRYNMQQKQQQQQQQ